MIEINHDIWTYDADWICITTNGMKKSDGTAVMGRGVALDATYKVTGIAKNLAKHLDLHGNVVGEIGSYGEKRVFSFPTKHHWKDDSDVELIRQSAEQLVKLWNAEFVLPKVILPRPGCGNGNLDWAYVKEMLKPIFVSNNFIIAWK